jgi:hypothetical protein
MTNSTTDFIDTILTLDGHAALVRKREVEAWLRTLRKNVSSVVYQTSATERKLVEPSVF